MAALGLNLCAEHRSLYSDTVSAIRTPDGVDAREVIKIACARHNAAFGPGLSQLAGKAFRIGHLGDLSEGMMISALGIAEMCLADAGARVEFGSGVGAALACYTEGRLARTTTCVAAR